MTLLSGQRTLNDPTGAKGTYAPRWAETHQTGNYTAAAGELVVCDGGAEQVITMPATPTEGDVVVVVRGTNIQQLNLSANAGQTINGLTGQNVFAPGNRVSMPYSSMIVLVAISPTAWVAVAQHSFVNNLSGTGTSFNDIQVEGSAYFNFNIWLTAKQEVTASGMVAAGTVVERYTGAGGITRTAPNNFGDTQILWLVNSSTGTVTFQPNGTGTIDGKGNLVLDRGQSALVMCLGNAANANWTVLGLSRTGTEGHFSLPGGDTPTISSVNTGLTSVTVSGNDTRGLLTVVVGAAPVAAFTGLFTLNFMGALYGSAPMVFLQEQDAAQMPDPQPYNVGATGFSVTNAGGSLAAGTTYRLAYFVVG